MKLSQVTEVLALGYHATIREEHVIDGLLVTHVRLHEVQNWTFILNRLSLR